MIFNRNKIILSELESPIENGLQSDSFKQKKANIFGLIIMIVLLFIIDNGLYSISTEIPFFSRYAAYISIVVFFISGPAIRHLFVGRLFSTVKIGMTGNVFLRMNNAYNTTFFDVKIHYDIFDWPQDKIKRNISDRVWQNKIEIGQIVSDETILFDFDILGDCIDALKKSDNYLLVISIIYVDGTFGTRKINKILLTKKHLRDGIMHSLR
jgi:hypothetical protein